MKLAQSDSAVFLYYFAWNTPLAHARYHKKAGGKSKTLVMRDVDCGFRSVLIARKRSAKYSACRTMKGSLRSARAWSAVRVVLVRV